MTVPGNERQFHRESRTLAAISLPILWEQETFLSTIFKILRTHFHFTHLWGRGPGGGTPENQHLSGGGGIPFFQGRFSNSTPYFLGK